MTLEKTERDRSFGPIALRRVSPKDMSFLCTVYMSTRLEELAQTDWDPSEKKVFLQSQFNAQHQYYLEQYPDAAYDIILLETHSIGRLYVDYREDEIRLMDIALLAKYRNQGIGGRLLHELLEKAKKQCKPVRIHVEQFNPAMKLYRRLGFQQLEDRGVYQFMEWTPVGASVICDLRTS